MNLLSSSLTSNSAASTPSPQKKSKPYNPEEKLDLTITYFEQKLLSIVECQVNEHGAPLFKKTIFPDDDTSTVLLGDNWLRDKREENNYSPGSTYLGSGFNKFGLRVSLTERRRIFIADG